MWLNYTRACKHCAADDEKCDMISLLHDYTLTRALGLLYGPDLRTRVDNSVVPRVLVGGKRSPYYCLRSAQKLDEEYTNLPDDEQEKWLSEKKRDAQARAEVAFIFFCSR